MLSVLADLVRAALAYLVRRIAEALFEVVFGRPPDLSGQA